MCVLLINRLFVVTKVTSATTADYNRLHKGLQKGYKLMEKVTNQITHDRLLQDCYWWAYNAYPAVRGHLWHIPNEVKPYPGESKASLVRRISHLKAIGMVPGVLDFGLLWAGVYYELDAKLPGDRISDAQKKRVEIVKNCYFFSSLQEFQAIFNEIVAK